MWAKCFCLFVVVLFSAYEFQIRVSIDQSIFKLLCLVCVCLCLIIPKTIPIYSDKSQEHLINFLQTWLVRTWIYYTLHKFLYMRRPNQFGHWVYVLMCSSILGRSYSYSPICRDQFDFCSNNLGFFGIHNIFETSCSETCVPMREGSWSKFNILLASWFSLVINRLSYNWLNAFAISKLSINRIYPNRIDSVTQFSIFFLFHKTTSFFSLSLSLLSGFQYIEYSRSRALSLNSLNIQWFRV